MTTPTPNLSLYWEAWPQGYAGFQGVWTLGGYVCCGKRGDQWLFRHPDSCGGYLVGGPEWSLTDTCMALIEAGEAITALLPTIDPTVPGAWAAIVAEAAVALWPDLTGESAQLVRSTNQFAPPWELSAVEPPDPEIRGPAGAIRKRRSRNFACYRADPAVALVEIRCHIIDLLKYPRETP